MKKKPAVIIAAFVAAFILIGIVFLYRMKTRNAVEQLAENKKMINVLIAGGNRYKERKFDFFAILSVNPDNNNIGVTFIPPTFRIGLDEDGNKSARIEDIDFIFFEKIRRSFWRDLKLNVPFYVELYSTDIMRLVDMLEGVNIFSLDQVNTVPFAHFGLNYFDGDKVMKYINSAEQNSIFLKYDRIMDVMLTLYYNKEEKKQFINADFIRELMNTLQTNMLPQEILSLSQYIFNPGNVMSTILPGNFKENYYVSDDITFKIYEKEFLGQIVLGAEEDTSAKVKVLNATKIPGLARKMRNTLNRDGFNVVEFSTSPYEMQQSIIISKKGDHQFVKKVSELTGIRNIYYIIDNTLLYSAIIILGEDLAK